MVANGKCGLRLLSLHPKGIPWYTHTRVPELFCRCDDGPCCLTSGNENGNRCWFSIANIAAQISRLQMGRFRPEDFVKCQTRKTRQWHIEANFTLPQDGSLVRVALGICFCTQTTEGYTKWKGLGFTSTWKHCAIRNRSPSFFWYAAFTFWTSRPGLSPPDSRIKLIRAHWPWSGARKGKVEQWPQSIHFNKRGVCLFYLGRWASASGRDDVAIVWTISPLRTCHGK